MPVDNHNLSNVEFAERLKLRTKRFALSVIRFSQSLPKSDESSIIKRQLLRSATSVAANYRASCRARSGKEFYAKMSIVVEEADEAMFWIELLEESGIKCSPELKSVSDEAIEILKIMASIRKSARSSTK